MTSLFDTHPPLIHVLISYVKEIMFWNRDPPTFWSNVIKYAVFFLKASLREFINESDDTFRLFIKMQKTLALAFIKTKNGHLFDQLAKNHQGGRKSLIARQTKGEHFWLKQVGSDICIRFLFCASPPYQIWTLPLSLKTSFLTWESSNNSPCEIVGFL